MIWSGFEASVSSPDRVWAHGLAGVIDEIAQKGQLPQYKRKRRPFKWWEIVALIAAVVGFGGIPLSLVLVDEWEVIPAVLIGLVLGMLPVMALTDAMDRRVENPSFRLLWPGEIPEAESEQATPGLAVRAQEFIRRRPVLNVFLAILLGFAINELSERI